MLEKFSDKQKKDLQGLINQGFGDNLAKLEFSDSDNHFVKIKMTLNEIMEKIENDSSFLCSYIWIL
jgi:hypothetical protein